MKESAVPEYEPTGGAAFPLEKHCRPNNSLYPVFQFNASGSVELPTADRPVYGQTTPPLGGGNRRPKLQCPEVVAKKIQWLRKKYIGL